MKRKEFTLTEAVMVTAVLLTALTLTTAAVGKAVFSAKTIDCQKSQTTLYKAYAGYAAAHGNTYPAIYMDNGTKSWIQYLMPFTGRGGMDDWRKTMRDFCPAQIGTFPAEGPGTIPYGQVNLPMNNNESLQLTKVKNPKLKVIMADGYMPVDGSGPGYVNEWSINFIAGANMPPYAFHEGGANLLFVDGHTDWGKKIVKPGDADNNWPEPGTPAFTNGYE